MTENGDFCLFTSSSELDIYRSRNMRFMAKQRFYKNLDFSLKAEPIAGSAIND
jgi:hypothetical protein